MLRYAYVETDGCVDMQASDITLYQATIPDSLPPLISGMGVSPVTGGCIMQVTNYLVHGTWTDLSSKNVTPHLTTIAICVNDAVCDEHRQQLWRFVPRLMKTYSDKLEPWSSRSMILTDALQDIKSTINLVVGRWSALRARRLCDEKTCQQLIDAMDAALDHYDHIMARPLGTVVNVDWRPLLPEALDKLTVSDVNRILASGKPACLVGVDLSWKLTVDTSKSDETIDELSKKFVELTVVQDELLASSLSLFFKGNEKAVDHVVTPSFSSM